MRFLHSSIIIYLKNASFLKQNVVSETHPVEYLINKSVVRIPPLFTLVAMRGTCGDGNPSSLVWPNRFSAWKNENDATVLQQKKRLQRIAHTMQAKSNNFKCPIVGARKTMRESERACGTQQLQ